jgi:hypothetical protein
LLFGDAGEDAALAWVGDEGLECLVEVLRGCRCTVLVVYRQAGGLHVVVYIYLKYRTAL